MRAQPDPPPPPPILGCGAVLAYFIAALSPNLDVANAALPSVRPKHITHCMTKHMTQHG